MEQLKPGMIAHESGEYEMYNEDGTDTGMCICVNKGETLPPTDRDGQYYCCCSHGKHSGSNG